MTDQAHVEIEHRFAMMPEALLYDSSISPDAVRIFGVLLRHGSDPSNCYPSHARIAGFIGRSKASINGWIVELERAGWVERVPRIRSDGSPDSNAYRLHLTARLPEGRAGEQGVPADERGGVPATQRPPSSLHSAPKESNGNESHLERENDRGPSSSAGQLALVDSAPPAVRDDALTLVGFDAFWRVFPRKVGKPSAKRAWGRAIRRANPVDIIAGAERYRDDPNREDEFTKYPGPWLNDDRWEAPPLPPRGGNNKPKTLMGSNIATLRNIAANGRAGAPQLGPGS